MSENPSAGSSIICARSVAGSVRSENEDRALAEQWTQDDPGPVGLNALMAVADGMGGHDRGGWASETAIKAVKHSLEMEERENSLEAVLVDAFELANREIYQSPERAESSKPPGTTLTVAAIRGQECAIAHVGDTRAYLIRDGGIVRLTQDHSLIEELVRDGQLTPEEALNSPLSSQLTKCIGIEADIVPDIHSFQLRSGDVVLLCSDGLTGGLSDTEIRDIVLSGKNAIDVCNELCSSAERSGSRDNISVVVYSHFLWRGSTAQIIC